MIRRPPRATRTDTLFPYKTLFRARKRRLTGTLSPTGNCPAPRLMANLDPPPRRPEIEAPAKAATDARADQIADTNWRSEEPTSELQVTNAHLVCRLLLEKKKPLQSKTRNTHLQHLEHRTTTP